MKLSMFVSSSDKRDERCCFQKVAELVRIYDKENEGHTTRHVCILFFKSKWPAQNKISPRNHKFFL